MTTGRLTQEVTEVLFSVVAKGRITQEVVEVLYVPGVEAPGGGGEGLSGQTVKMIERPLPGAQVDNGHQYGRGLIGAWLCRDISGTQLVDYSPYRNTGVQTNMPALAWQHSPVGWCLEFSDTDQVANIQQSENLIVGSGVTVSAWVLSNVTQSEAGIVNDQLAWLLRTAAAADKIEFVVEVGFTEFVATQSLTDLSVKTWTHVVGTWGAATDNDVMLIINGGEEVVVGANTPGPIDASGGKVKIGEAAGNAFQGRVRDVLLYNRSMTPAEAAGLYRLDLSELFN